MRILIASGTWYPERNGVARVASEVGRRLADRGHRVTALVPRVPELPAEEREGSLTVRRVVRRGPLPLIVNDIIETSRASRRAESFDVLLAHGASCTLGLARARPTASLVSVYHASLLRELRFMRPRLPWGRERLVSYVNEPISSVVERAAVERAMRILVLSNYSRSLLMADHPRQEAKIQAVSGGVETAAFNPGAPREARQRLDLDPDRRLLVTIRRAEPRMGIEQLLRALRIMQADDVALAIVGGGILTDELHRLSAELGLDGRVHFAGRVSEEVLPDWYRAADVFVLPTVAYEGFGMVTLEALASRTPVVGTPVGATPELLEPLDPRLVARGSDPESLAKAISETLSFADDDAFRARCREYALARFDWDKVIAGWEGALIDAATGVGDRSETDQSSYPQKP
jgi:glycosyltransferase involved in cell wall biosynthesis